MAGRGSKPGERRGGRKKGSRNKLTTALKDMVLSALTKAGGERYLVKQARENPTAFMTLLGKVLPTQVDGSVEHHYVALLPEVPKTTDEWKRQYAPQTLQ